MKIPDIRKLLILSFVALGPLGNLLTPAFLPEAFRTYYLLLPAFPLFFTKFQTKQVKTFILLAPFFLYCLVSSLCVELFGEPKEPYPLFRCFLFLFNLCFIVGGSNILNKTEDLIKIYLKWFFISLIIGYVFYIGFYLNLISFSFISRFSIIAQFGYGLLRFAPGSYPNEYGTVASFVLSVLTLHLIHPCNKLNISKKATFLFFILTFFALLLTTTRSAYLGYLYCLIYIAWKTNCFFYLIRIILSTFVSLLLILKYFGINFLQILSTGFDFVTFQDGTTGERLSNWNAALENFHIGPFFGSGFASLTNLHNLYLQFFLELGLIGIALVLCIVLFWIFNFPIKWYKVQKDSEYFFFNTLKMLGLIQVLWFALTNHNLNHHLTWFILFLFIKDFQENVVNDEVVRNK